MAKLSIFIKALKCVFYDYWLLYTIIFLFCIIIIIFREQITFLNFYNKPILIAFGTSLTTFFLTTWTNYYNEITKNLELKKYLQNNILICSKIILENFIDKNKANNNFNGENIKIEKFRSSKEFDDFVTLKEYNFADLDYLFNSNNKVLWEVLIETYFKLNNIKDIDKQYLQILNMLVDNYQKHFKPIIFVSSASQDKISTEGTIKNLCALINFDLT